MASGGQRFPGPDRRRHFRVEGEWNVRIAAVEQTGAVSEFDARALNIAMGGILLETVVQATSGTDEPAGPSRIVARASVSPPTR